MTGSDSVLLQLPEQAKDLWLDHINAKGGLLGRPVKFIEYDDQTDAATATTLYEKLITEDKVDLVVGPLGTAQTHGSIGVTEKYGYVNCVYISISTQMNQAGYKYYFNTAPSGEDASGLAPFESFFDYLGTLTPKPKTVAMLTFNYEFNTQSRDGILKYLPANGYDLVVDEIYPDPSIDFTPLVSKVKAANPDVFYLNGLQQDGLNIMNAAARIGYNGGKAAYTPWGSAPPYVTGGSAVENTFLLGLWEPIPPWSNITGAQEFINLYKAKYNSPAPGYVAWTYSAFQALEQAVEATKSIDNATLANWLHSNPVNTVWGQETFHPNGWVDFGFFLTQIQGGKAVTVWPTDKATAQPVYPRP